MSDYIPNFSLDSSPEVDDGGDMVLAGGGDDMAHLVRMNPEERDNYLTHLLERLVGRSTPTSSILITTNPPAVTELVGDNSDTDEGVYIAIIIIGCLVALWFIVVVINSIYRCSSSHILTIDGLGHYLNRVVVAIGAVLAIRRLPVRRDVRSCYMGEELRDLGSNTTVEESLCDTSVGESGGTSQDGVGDEDDVRILERTVSFSSSDEDVPPFPPSYNEATQYSTPRVGLTPYSTPHAGVMHISTPRLGARHISTPHSIPAGIHNPWFRSLDEEVPRVLVPPPGSEKIFKV